MLVGILPDATYHYWRNVQEDRYIIWAEDGESNSFHGGNRKAEQQLTGTIDLFTKTEYDSAVYDLNYFINDTGNLVLYGPESESDWWRNLSFDESDTKYEEVVTAYGKLSRFFNDGETVTLDEIKKKWGEER